MEMDVAELARSDVRGVETEAVSVLEGLEVATLSGGNVQCSCLKYRKVSPSVRGQAMPRCGAVTVSIEFIVDDLVDCDAW